MIYQTKCQFCGHIVERGSKRKATCPECKRERARELEKMKQINKYVKQIHGTRFPKLVRHRSEYLLIQTDTNKFLIYRENVIEPLCEFTNKGEAYIGFDLCLERRRQGLKDSDSLYPLLSTDAISGDLTIKLVGVLL